MRDKNRVYLQLRCNITKTVRLDDFTYDVIISYRGSSFADKLRNYVFDVESGRYNSKDVLKL